MNMIEKILARASGKQLVLPGDIVTADIDMALIHEATGMPTLLGFNEIGCKKIWDSNKVCILFDHTVPAADSKSAENEKQLREFAKAQEVKAFYDIKAGVCHQVMPEKGHVHPGDVIVGVDSHTCSYGAFGAFGTGIGSTEMTSVLATGKLWFKVPESLHIIVNGSLPKGVSAKDIILKITGEITSDGAGYKSIEFSGSTIEQMSLSGRITLCNMAIEMGAKAGMIKPDQKVFDYLKTRSSTDYTAVYPDSDAQYQRVISFDVSDLEPQISCPHAVDNVKPITEAVGTKVNQAFLGSCTNGRLEDLQVAVDLLKGKKVHPDVRMIVIPASTEVYLEAVKLGLIQTFLESECVVCSPGCGPCFGGPKGVLAANEVCIASSNRNFKGRMGKGSYIYLASPLTVTAAALVGEIVDPRQYLEEVEL